MVKTLLYYFKTARPVQWIKNLSVFAALLFSGLFFNPVFFWPVAWTLVILSITVSGIYFLNDVIDHKRDRLHSFKKYRPVAQGLISIPSAVVIGVGLISLGLLLAFYLSVPLFLVVLGYIILQLAYSVWLKHLPILDIASIATGFILRVYAGAVVANLHMSVWFLICIIAFSLFVAATKRRSEYINKKNHLSLKQRPVFKFYNLNLLDVYISMFANTTWLSYTLFAYFHPLPISNRPSSLNLILPRTFYTQKWLMVTVPLVIYGVMRYLLLAYQYNQGESPARTFLKDKPLVISVSFWLILILIILNTTWTV